MFSFPRFQVVPSVSSDGQTAVFRLLHLSDLSALNNLDARLFNLLGDFFANVVVERPQYSVLPYDHGDLRAQMVQDCGHFDGDVTGSDHDCGFGKLGQVEKAVARNA